MGKYLNPGNLGLQSAINSQIYVDKTGLLEKINRVIGTEQRWICVSRARRFGKTMTAKMLAAYLKSHRSPTFASIFTRGRRDAITLILFAMWRKKKRT